MELRRTGIGAIGDAPWGSHFCVLYATADDLSEILVPYFKAGLENNEFCLWLTSPPLDSEQAWQRLAAVVPGLDDHRRRGSLEIIPRTAILPHNEIISPDEWRPGSELDRILSGWVDRLEAALGRGLAGLRLAGEAFRPALPGGPSLVEIETAVESVIRQRPMLAVCTCAESRGSIAELADLARSHELLLFRRDGPWERMEGGRRDAAALRRERQRFFDLLEALPAVICLLTPDYHVAFANRSFRRRFGESRDRPCYEVRFGLSAPCESCQARTVLETGKPHHWELVTPDGRRVLDIYDVPFTDVDGSPLILQMDLDITQRRRTEDALCESEARYRNLFDTTSDGVLIFDLEGRIRSANDAYCRMSGHSHDEIVAMSVSDLEAVESPREVAEHIGKLVRAGGHDRFESKHRRKNGTTVDLDITALYLETEGQIALAARDITKRKRLEEEMSRHLAAIEEANEAKDLFFNTLSHELRTPLAAMLNAVEVLKGPEASEAERAQMVGALERNVLHQTRLIEDLLDLSRIVRKKVQISHEPQDLRALVAEQVTAAEPEARRSRLTLSSRLPEQPVVVLGDGVRLGQVTSNLLGNALKYTESGGAVTVTVASEGAYAVVRIEDTGIGISPELLPHVFDAFRQADTSLTRSKGGLGIGLAIARSLTELHGGTLEVSSEGLGRGSAFVLRLPLSARRSPTPPTGPQQPVRTLPRRILLVEDSVDVRETLALLLGRMGHTVITAGSGSAAIALARREPLDLALIDIGLPDIDGYEVAARLRSEAATRDLRLIALTGYVGPQHRHRALQAGFDRHLPKPVDARTLRQVVDEEPVRRSGRFDA